MDYDWKYFMDDLKNGTTGIRLTEQDRAAAVSIHFRMEKGERDAVRGIVRAMMTGYREQTEAERALFEELMKAHGEYCRLLPDEDIHKKRHNAAVYRYMINTPLHNMAVSRKMNISRETLQGYIRKLTDDLVLLLQGAPAAGGGGTDTRHCIIGILESLPLIRMSQGIRGSMAWQALQQEREKHLSITADVLHTIDLEISLYEEFIRGSSRLADQERSLDTLKAVYFGGGIPEIMSAYGVSCGTVYADIRKMTKRLAELTDYMTAGAGRSNGGG